MDEYIRDGERYSYEIANPDGGTNNSPNFASRVLGYTLYYGIRKFTGDAGYTHGNMSQYWRDRHNNPTTRYTDVLHSRANDIAPPAITRTGGGKFEELPIEMPSRPRNRDDRALVKPVWYGPNDRQFSIRKNGRFIPWQRLTSAEQMRLYQQRASGRGRIFRSNMNRRGGRRGTRKPMSIAPRGGRSGFARGYRAPTNYATVQRGGGAYLSRNIRTLRGMGKVMKYKAFVGTLVFKTTGATELKINTNDCGGQIYFNPSLKNYFGDTPFQVQAALYEHYRWVSVCVEFTTRLPTTDVTGVIWGASDDPCYFRKVGVATATTNITKPVLLAMAKSGTYNAWTPRVCVNLPVNRTWLWTAGPDSPTSIFVYTDSSAAQRETYGGVLGVTLEGTTPGSDTVVANVWMDQKIIVRKIGTTASSGLSTNEIKVPLEVKEKYDKAMMLVNDDNFDVDRCLADLKLVDSVVDKQDNKEEKAHFDRESLSAWELEQLEKQEHFINNKLDREDRRWNKMLDTRQYFKGTTTPTPSKLDEPIKPKSSSLK